MDAEEVVSRLDNVKKLPSGWSARCPAHDDRVASLMVNTGKDGGVVLKCHAGCETPAVLAAIGLSFGDLMGSPRIVALHQYLRVDGSLAYTVERWANPKTFRCNPGLPAPADRVLYQLPSFAYARESGALVYVVEGEKDADRLISLGFVATCNVTGAGAWLPHYSESLKDCHVCVIADNDRVGREHARAVAAATRPFALTLSVMVPRTGKDVSDLLDAGYGIDQLDPLPEVEEAGGYVASTVRTRGISWLWPGYFALGKLSIVEGDPGDGKSILTVDLAARWSTGSPMPDASDGTGPWPIIMVSAEDDMEDTIVPRLISAGARLDGIHLIVHGATPDEPFDFSSGLSYVESLARRTGARVITFDPLMAFLGEKTDSHNDASVRRALQPLKTLAHRTGAAVIAVRHLNKGGSGGKAIYRGGGSIAFTGAARATFLVAPDPRDPVVRVFACVKSNLAAKPPSLRYSIEAGEDGQPFIEWRGAVDITAQGVLDGPEREDEYDDEEKAVKRRARRMEADFLEFILRDGPKPWADIVAAGKGDGFSEITLRRARADIGLEKVTGSEGGRSVTWALPGPLAPLLTSSGQQTVSPTSEQESKWEPDPPLSELAPAGVAEPTLTESDRIEALTDAPYVCSVCGSDVGARKFEDPWWTVRCKAHDPRDYHGGAS